MFLDATTKGMFLAASVFLTVPEFAFNALVNPLVVIVCAFISDCKQSAVAAFST